uniref:Alkylphosphonate utilization operon protein PhnA n=1 Tax=uncultured Thiotrichaceae bacterium TaxID=298394 RepID=A0A6S6SJB9_9GAMM|nr:MAG: Alkylphosphonate utilization operon protein PhnA [uncultured Thiotrichaceae bacterium]
MMTIEKQLMKRSHSICELCGADSKLSVYEIPPVESVNAENCILVCDTCLGQIEDPSTKEANHWRCLNDSMWSQEPAVQVMAWRLLDSLRSEGWPQDLLDMLYLEESVQKWAEAEKSSDNDTPSVDCNGAKLESGDTVTITKDLVIKGANFTAKRGTAVRNISLTQKPTEIEGKVNGVRIVLATRFLKKN